MFKSSRALSASAALCLAASGCGDDGHRVPTDVTTDTTPDAQTCEPTVLAPDTLFASWDNARGDKATDALVLFADATTRFARVPRLTLGTRPAGFNTSRFIIETVERLDATGDVIHRGNICNLADELESCTDGVMRLDRGVQPGDNLAVTLTWREREGRAGCESPTVETQVVRITMGDDVLPAAPPASTRALAAHTTSNGTLWFGLLGHGLTALASDGTTAFYGAVPSDVPWLAEIPAPQTPLLFAIEDAGDGALWIGGATTGVTWFDPGAKLNSRDDDAWLHGQPVTVEDDPLKELAETTVALLPDGDGGLWVASLSGVHHVTRGTPTLNFDTVAPGAYFALAVDSDGTLWAGHSATDAIIAEWGGEDGDPWPEAALIAIRKGEGGAFTTTAYDVGFDTVTAIAVDGDTVIVGSPAGVFAFDRKAATPAVRPVAAALLGGLTITGLAVEARGVWVGARDECVADAGKLVLIDVAGSDDIVIADATDAGFGTRDFNALKRLADGRLFVSTVVPSSPLWTGGSRDCIKPKPEDYMGNDAFVFDVTKSGPPVAIAP